MHVEWEISGSLLPLLPKYYLTISQFTMILKNGSFQFDLFCEHCKKLVVCGGAMLERS